MSRSPADTANDVHPGCASPSSSLDLGPRSRRRARPLGEPQLRPLVGALERGGPRLVADEQVGGDERELIQAAGRRHADVVVPLPAALLDRLWRAPA